MPEVFLGCAGVLPEKLPLVFHDDGCRILGIFIETAHSTIKISFLCAGSIFGGMLMCLKRS